MTRQLILLRHGKSDWSHPVTDYERPLTRRGERNAEQIGAWLGERGAVPEVILSSGACRALSTAQRAGAAMGFPRSRITVDDRLYGATAGKHLRVLGELAEAPESVMVVAHNPGLDDLLTYLVGRPPRGADGKIMPTATAALLDMPDRWDELAPGCGRLVALQRPRELPRKFLDAAGRRRLDRPAYYYHQAAALPWRRRPEGLQVLVLRSRSGKRWLFPKGIIDPGLTGPETALKEAEEEAGMTGRIGARSLGRTTAEKWGGRVTIDVYPLEVTGPAPAERWRERDRESRWLAPSEAARLLDDPRLVEMLTRFTASL